MALRILPSQVLKKFLFFALYLLGVRLNTIASLVDMPEESGKTTIGRVMKDGIAALHDRSQTAKTNEVHITAPLSSQVTVLTDKDYCAITFGDIGHQLKIPRKHQLPEILSVATVTRPTDQIGAKNGADESFA